MSRQLEPIKLLHRVANLILDNPFLPIENQLSIESRDQAIPPIVYQTWEENSFGRRHRASMAAFREKNRDLSFVLFDKEQRDRYMKINWKSHPIVDLYFQSRFGPMRADMFRYCILFERGGYYFDISKGVDCAITSLHPGEAKELLSFENNKAELPPGPSNLILPNNLIIQWGMGFTAGHPVLNHVIQSIVQNSINYLGKIVENPKTAILELTGPVAMTRAVHHIVSNTRENLFQVAIDFDGSGIYAMKGSGARHLRYPSYASVRNEQIFSK